MTAAAFILGHRTYDNTDGVFVAPPGVDAATAGASALLLHISLSAAQVLLRGYSASLPATVTLGLTSYVPIVIIQNYFAGTGGARAGFARPVGDWWNDYISSVAVAADFSTMYISASASVSGGIAYSVFNRPV